MNYHLYSTEDFLADEAFIDWATAPTAENNAFWQNWMSEHPERRDTVESARAVLESIDFSEKWTEEESRRMWENIQAKTQVDQPVIPLHSRVRKWILFPYAAAMALLFITGGLFYWIRQPFSISTAYGKQQQLTLSDGTKITLNANSTLTYGRDLGDAPQREVWISGEAFFEVARVVKQGKKVPFTVHTDQLDIEVLGTAFNITNRHGRVDVALEHGSVKLVDPNNQQNTLFLKPGEKATQMTSTAPIRKEKTDVKEYSSWTQKVIRYKRKSLKDLSEMIHDTYGVETIIENKALLEETFTGSFPADSVTVFFEKLGKLYPVEITKEDGKYYLR